MWMLIVFCILLHFKQREISSTTIMSLGQWPWPPHLCPLRPHRLVVCWFTGFHCCLWSQVRWPRQADPLQRRDQRGPQQPSGARAEGGGGSPQRPAVRPGPGRHHREWVCSPAGKSELRLRLSEGGGRPWSAAVSQTPSLLSSVLSAYRGAGPVITGLKCVYGPSQLATFFIFATHRHRSCASLHTGA